MILLARDARRALRRILLGNTDLPQQCTIGLRDPQSEVSVWLHGLGTPRDITDNHVLACAVPLLIGLGFDPEWGREPNPGTRVSLKFHERGGSLQLLGEISLQYSTTVQPKVQVGGRQLHLFEACGCKNYCLPKTRLWAHYMHQALVQRHDRKNTDVPISMLGSRSMGVFFICPRPVVLVSLACGGTGNIFPMNLMGAIGTAQFAFALNSARQAAPLVERAGRIALSSVPLEQSAVARELGKNHRREFIHWNQLPFRTTPSTALQIPVPDFALRVRELEIQTVRNLGSHTLFVARVVRDERWSEGLQFCMIHGIYQAYLLNRGQQQAVSSELPSVAR